MSDRGHSGAGRKPTGCPIDFALDVFGDRWSLLVVRDLLFKGKRHFHELVASEEGIATNTLTARLEKLVTRGIVRRFQDPNSRKQIVYELTDKGLDLVPLLIEIIRWSGKHDPNTAAPKAFLRRAERDRDGLVNDAVAAARQRTIATRKT